VHPIEVQICIFIGTPVCTGDSASILGDVEDPAPTLIGADGHWKEAAEANVDVWMKPVVPLTLNPVPVSVAPIWPIVP